MNERYRVDQENNFIFIDSKRYNIRCKYCNNSLATIGDNLILFRTYITLLDFPNNLLKVKCGKCKKINDFSYETLYNNQKVVISINHHNEGKK